MVRADYSLEAIHNIAEQAKQEIGDVVRGERDAYSKRLDEVMAEIGEKLGMDLS